MARGAHPASTRAFRRSGLFVTVLACAWLAPRPQGRLMKRYEKSDEQLVRENKRRAEFRRKRWLAQSMKHRSESSIVAELVEYKKTLPEKPSISLKELLSKDSVPVPTVQKPKINLSEIKKKPVEQLLTNVSLSNWDSIRKELPLFKFFGRGNGVGARTLMKIKGHVKVFVALGNRSSTVRVCDLMACIARFFDFEHGFETIIGKHIKNEETRERLRMKLKSEFKWFYNKGLLILDDKEKMDAMKKARRQHRKLVRLALSKAEEKKRQIAMARRKVLKGKEATGRLKKGTDKQTVETMDVSDSCSSRDDDDDDDDGDKDDVDEEGD